MPVDLNVAGDLEALNDPEAKQILSELEADYEANPLYLYEPHVKQAPFHAARVKTKVFVGGNRSGKSSAGTVDDLIQCLDEEWVPEALRQYKIWQPPFKCRIVTPDFKRTHAAILESFQKWTPPGALRGGGWDKAYEKQERILWFANGSFVEFMTLEQDREQFGGNPRHRVHFDEEPAGDKGREIREECIARLIDFNGDEIYSFTPLHGLGWTHEEFEEGKGPEVAKDVWLNDDLIVVRADMDDNPHLSEAGKARALAMYPEEVRAARKSGNFRHFKGLVYPMFDRDIHVVAEPSVQHVRKLPLLVEGIDPGVETTAILFAGFDKDNCLLIYDELFLGSPNSIPENAAQMIRDKRAKWGLRQPPRYTVIDPSSRNRSLTDHADVRNAYRAAGIPTQKAKNDVEVGVWEIMRRLEHKNPKTGEPEPLVLVAETCEGLLKEIRRYRQKDTKDEKFAVVKKDDHRVDILRYIAQVRPTAPVARRKAPPQRRWIPGTAPPYRPPKSRNSGGPMGKYT